MRVFIDIFGDCHAVETQNCTTVGQLASSLTESHNLPESVYLAGPMGALPLDAAVCDVAMPNQRISVALSLCGGGKKRKQFSTPKKNKHKRVNVEKSVLDNYAIDENGNVKRVRKLCQQEGCKNRGIFMASHWNRYYCGNCHLTLIKKDAPKEEPKRVKKVVKEDPKKGKKGKK